MIASPDQALATTEDSRGAGNRSGDFNSARAKGKGKNKTQSDDDDIEGRD